ncbi:Na+:solute symporter [Sphingobacterium sp. SGG-5]|uniref:sodium:solute symporter family protein n=1 Tax=Sphingobacterium sp. SGG-5 TaxID=2710881 RepID=UPI0013EA7924|nr:sodium:solute symporter family protein [Sphingobacterium sp. SGG-5]NGM61489.1 Na+:solute symporter [Sphingobacterium sp. SGG-5]
MTALDYWVIAIFSIGILVAGLSMSDKKADMKSYFGASGALPWWMSGLSLYMGFFSAGTFVVWGAIAYEQGWVAVTIQWTMAIAGFLIGKWIAPRWRQTGVLTAAEFLQERFGPKVHKFYTYVFLFMSFAYNGAFLYPVAKLVNVSTGLSAEYAIILFGIMAVLYTTSGGLWAVIVTNVLQFVVLTAAVLIVVPLAFDRVGGVSTFVQDAPEGFFNFTGGEYSLWFMVAFGLYNMIFIGGNWAYVQRYTSVPTKKDAKKVGYTFGWLYLISPVIWMLPPMLYRFLNVDLAGMENEGAYLMMCKEVLPQGIMGLMITGMIFATTDSVNASLNVSSAVFTNDVYKRLYPNAKEKSLMWVARLSTLLFGVITVGVALMVPAMGGIVEVVLSIGALTGVALYGPGIWALFSKRQTAFSILFTSIASLAINLFFKFLAPSLLNITLGRMAETVLGVFLPLALLLFFELFHRKKVEVLVTTESDGSESETTPADIELEAEALAATNQQSKMAIRTVGYALLGVGSMIFILGLVSSIGRISVLSVSGVIIILGLLAVYRSRK